MNKLVKIVINTSTAALFSLSSLSFASTTTDIDEAFMRADTAGIIQLAKQADDYDQAFAAYRLSTIYNYSGNAEQRNKSILTAQSELEQLLEKEPKNAEALALLANIYGLQSHMFPEKAAFLGPQAGQAMHKALSIDATNPRVQLIAGIGEYYTPTEYGGSKEKAIARFNTAIELFESNDSSWGHADAQVWIGLALLETGHKNKALEHWQQALRIAPDYAWPAFLLEQNQ
ncbi:tetratricopeptide repeat protein [Agaribacterium sp. ZY112]|uniref:tetratricopeptide repeat protein n=1 Tax=Agaribacterium sp. ZY112 TaxID=3233574 RepID=UPI003523D655